MKNLIMVKKEDVSTVADIFEMNTLHHWCTNPCVIKTQRYSYIKDSGCSVESPNRTIIGCEKSQNGYKEGVSTVADIFEINTLHHWCTCPWLSKLSGMAIYGTLEVVLKPPTER